MVEPAVADMSVYLVIALLTTAANRWRMVESAVAEMIVYLAIAFKDCVQHPEGIGCHLHVLI